MVFLIKAAQLILSLGILVIVHEFGHFAFARLFNTRVEKFRLFFDPWFSLWKKKIGETEYGIGWIPLGGYVKISGMIDESMDKEQMKLPAEPWEFRSKPAWQRLFIMIGGVLFNLIFAILIYISVLWAWGDLYLPAKNVTYGVECSDVAKEIGFKDGDKILKVDGNAINDFFDASMKLLLDDINSITVEREGQMVDVPIRPEHVTMLIQNSKSGLFKPRFPFVVNKFVEGSGAKTAGMQSNDKLLAINGKSLIYFDEISNELGSHKSEKVQISVLRQADTLQLNVQVSEDGKIGVYPKPMNDFLTFETINYTFTDAIGAGISKGVNKVGEYLKQIKLLLKPENKAHKQLGSFGTIGSIFSPSWNWEAFWDITAFISIMLAVMNMLPIPALDGGHVMFLMYEIITGRKPNEKVMEYAQIAGMVILLGLMLFATYNDLDRWVFSKWFSK